MPFHEQSRCHAHWSLAADPLMLHRCRVTMHVPHLFSSAADGVHIMEHQAIVLAASQQQRPRIEQRTAVELQPGRLVFNVYTHSG